MEQPDIIKLTRRGIREPRPVSGGVDDDEITTMTIQGVNHFGMLIKRLDSSFYNKRKSISSNTHLFTKPSDCLSVLRVWDLNTNAISVTATADSGGEIQITSADHGFSDDAIVVAHDVGGTTEADGTWLTTLVDDDNFTLDGSVYANAWTSGGKAFVDPKRPRKIEKKLLQEADLSSRNKWYPRGNYIVVDDDGFENDIIVDYIRSPSAITDIPTEYHMGLVAWNVINLIRVPDETDRKYPDTTASYQFNVGLLKRVEEDLKLSFEVSTEPDGSPQGISLEDYAE